MIQKIRWLSALALLLAVGAVTVRAEEEEAPPSSRPTAELLPAPLPVAVDRPCCTPALPPGMWSFFAPAPFPCPCPAPLMPAGFVSYGDGCACPSCSCPNCPLCTMSPSAPAEEYVVDLKMVEGGDGDPDTAISHPRLCVLEGQTGTVQTAAAGSKEQSTLQMQATLTKLDVGAILNLRVEQGSSFTPGNNVLQAAHRDDGASLARRVRQGDEAGADARLQRRLHVLGRGHGDEGRDREAERGGVRLFLPQGQGL